MQDHNLYYFFGNPNKDKENGVFYDILPIGTPANKLKIELMKKTKIYIYGVKLYQI